MRLHVTSSGFPLWDRNPNTGHEQGMDAEFEIAEHTVYHGERYPSCPRVYTAEWQENT